jgi:hypothetical protein
MGETAAGLIVKLGEDLCFVPATMVERVLRQPVMSVVPRAPVKMALLSGTVVAVIELGPPADELLVCRLGGEEVGFSGLAVLGSGFYELVDERVRFGENLVRPLDLEDELQRAERRFWSSRPPPGGADQ